MRSTSCGMSRFIWSEVQPGSAHRRMAELAHELEESRRLYVRDPGRPRCPDRLRAALTTANLTC